MMRGHIRIAVLLGAAGAVFGQWEIQESHSTVSLRGIHSVDGVIAWASGTGGTVLRTIDAGSNWIRCATPPGSEALDFRAVWAWDAKHAMVMSAGPGEQSRVYRTTDGCATWTDVIRNTSKDGFWDGLVFNGNAGVLVGDPVDGRFETKTGSPAGAWEAVRGCAAQPGESAFAASNSSVFVFGPARYVLGTGGRGGARVLLSPLLAHGDDAKDCLGVPTPVGSGNESSGVFSLAFRDARHGVAVGGDYRQPGENSRTAAWSADGGRRWTESAQPPRGYRSAVAWDGATKSWVAAGTSGSDVSRDDGKTWQPLDDWNWNALSLPFAVGPKGRIGKLRAGSLRR